MSAKTPAVKLQSLLIGTLGLLSFSAGALAITTPHYAVTFSGAITSQVSFTGTSAKVHTAKVSNSTILKQALQLSGTGVVASVKDMDIVFDPNNTELDVINITDPANITVLYTIVIQGGNYALNGTIYSGNSKKILGVSTSSDVEVTLPGDNTLTCNATSDYSYNPATDVPTGFAITLTGNDNSRLITARIKKGKKVYNY